MPVVLRIGPYVFFFYSQENNEPPHIHVRRDESIAKYWLKPFGLDSAYGFAPHELNRIARLVQQNQKMLLEAWNDYF
jgi:hypothetical protein